MKKYSLILIALFALNTAFAQIFMAKDCNITFFSYAPLENIEAINKAAKPILNTTTGNIQVKISVRSFKFTSALMEEHFNENYMETEKYPDAFFKGKINDTIDWTKDGEYKVTVTGKLTIHGVEKERKLDGTVVIKGGLIRITTKFKIHIADHGIKVPSMYVQNIAEDVDVTLDAVLEPYKSK